MKALMIGPTGLLQSIKVRKERLVTRLQTLGALTLVKTLDVIYSNGARIKQYVGDSTQLSKPVQKIMNEVRRLSARGDWLGRHRREVAASIIEYSDGQLDYVIQSSDMFLGVENRTVGIKNVENIKKIYDIHSHPSAKTGVELTGDAAGGPFSFRDLGTLIKLRKDIREATNKDIPVEGYVLPECDRCNDIYYSWSADQPVDNVILAY
ncbi:MAG: hypothetical protein AB1540_15925 [Bdellovibrionota bacterium]